MADGVATVHLMSATTPKTVVRFALAGERVLADVVKDGGIFVPDAHAGKVTALSVIAALPSAGN